mgnify:CR=1 FL=1
MFARVTLSDGSVVETAPAWLVVGSPKYAPEIVNITTLADTMEDVAIRKNGARPDIFPGGDTCADWPKDPRNGYTPLQGFNPEYVVNFANPKFDLRVASAANADTRMRYFELFRMPLLPKDYAQYYATMSKGPGQLYALKDNDPDQLSGLPMMPLNSGDNSVTNTGPIYKFETLSPTQYFYLYQWARGKFTTDAPDRPSLAEQLDRADASNCVGAPFSPGIEVTWSVRSAAIYAAPLHLKLAHLDGGYGQMTRHYAETGLATEWNECLGGGCEPGDLTKRMAIPWMADFHECKVQTHNINNIHIDQLADGSGIEVPPAFYVYWRPPQSPFNVTTGTTLPQDHVLDAFVSDIDGQTIIPQGQNVEFQRGIDSAQKMIDSWFMLGFLLNRGTAEVPYIVETERNFGQLAQAHIQDIATAAAAASTAAKG